MSQRTPIGNTQGNPLFRGYMIPRSYYISNYPYQNANGSQSYYDTSTDNPFWTIDNNTYKDRVDRILANVNISYDITDWLSVDYKLGTDTYTMSIRQIDGIGSIGNASGAGAASTGGMEDNNAFVSQTSSYLNIHAKKRFGDFSTVFIVGNEINQSMERNQGVFGTGATVGGFGQITSYTNYNPYNVDDRRRLIGIYGEATVGYKDYLYVTLSGRNDWSSTFAKGKNSFFYPSATLSLVLTDAVPTLKDNPNVLSFAKLRAAAVRVGREAPIYSTDTYFGRSNPASGFGPNIQYPFRTQMGYTLSNAAGNPNINPEFTTSMEGGLEARFWKDRISLDVTYFETNTTDIILGAPTSVASGFSSQTRNAGELKTNGWELTLGIIPVKTSGFEWRTNI